MSDVKLFIPADSMKPKELNNTLSDFMSGNPLTITNIKRVIQEGGPNEKRAGWEITYEQ